MKWATCTEKPMETAVEILPQSHVDDSISPIAAEARVPRWPTMAASMKNISTVVICANIEGMLKSTIRLNISLRVISSWPRIFASNISLLRIKNIGL